MWPRTEEEHARGHNSGFVSFMHRPDAEEAYANLHERIDGRAVRLAWGKAVARERAPRPPLPGQVYGGSERTRFASDAAAARADASRPPVLVQPPLDLTRRREIDALAAQAVAAPDAADEVVRGARASGRRGMAFLWEEVAPDGRGSEDGNYFRWRVHSLRSGGTASRWRTAPLALVDGGPLWIPPTCSKPLGNPPLETPPSGDGEGVELMGSLESMSRGAPVALVSAAGVGVLAAADRGASARDVVSGACAAESSNRCAGMQNSDGSDLDAANFGAGGAGGGGDGQGALDAEILTLLKSVAALDERLDTRSRAELGDILSALDTSNATIAGAMCFCIDNSRRAGDVAATICGRMLALCTTKPPPPPEQGLALLYLLTDILANGDAGGGAHAHRARLAALAPVAVGCALGRWIDALSGHMVQAKAATGVARVFDAWEKLRIFDLTFLESLRTAALGARAREICDALSA